MEDFVRRIGADLNSRQSQAVTSTEGRVRVIAGAGTGKTKALTYRYAYLVNVLGIDPANILCLTFTNKAAAEMRQRIATMVHSGDYNDFVCTIDGFCVKFLRKEIHRLGFPKTFTILDEEDAKSVAKQSMDELGIKRTEKTVKEFLGQVAVQKGMTDYIDTYMLPGVKWTDAMLKSGPANYIHRQMKNYALDFDDLENLTSYILDHFQDAREYWQGQLNYIMVDEAQDCNLDNWQIIEKLAAGHNNLFVVGDPDQAIYEWRGAKPERFVRFASDKDVVLDENYRSTPKILDVANSVIANNKNRIPKDLFTRKPEGRAVIHFHGKTEADEMEWVVRQVRLLLDAGAGPGEMAVLYRATFQSRAIEQELLKAGIQYTIWGGTRFFERKEIKDALSYLRLINDPDDDLAFERIVNVPSRKLGRKYLETLKERARMGGRSLYGTLSRALGNRAGDPAGPSDFRQSREQASDDLRQPRELATPDPQQGGGPPVSDLGQGNRPSALDKPGAREFMELIEDGREYSRSAPVSDLLDRILDRSGLKRMLREDQDEDRLENVDELLKSVRFYESSRPGEDAGLSEYLQDIALYTNQDYRKDSPAVKLMTVHQAKGLEFPYVFVIGLSEGIFPNMRSIREYKKDGEEEERRLMYVAITRAEKALFLTESEGFNVSTKMGKYPSRFLTEIKRHQFVTEGAMPEDLWKGTRNMVHVLDEEYYSPAVASDGFAAEREGYMCPFKAGDKVVHDVFGEGTIISANKVFTTFEVRFGDGTTRHLRAAFLRPQDLPE